MKINKDYMKVMRTGRLILKWEKECKKKISPFDKMSNTVMGLWWKLKKKK